MADTDLPLLTPRGGKESKQAKLELDKLRTALRSRVSKSLNKLCDRDTQNNAVAEFNALCEEEPLPVALASVVASALIALDTKESAFARIAVAKMFFTLANTQFAGIQPSLAKVVANLVKRTKDKDPNVRDAIGTAFGELARVLVSAGDGGSNASSNDDTLDPDASTADSEGGPTLGVFFKPLLQTMESAEEFSQQGCALALAHVIFCSGPAVKGHLEKLTTRIIAILGNNQFQGRKELLIAVANMMEVCPDGVSAKMARLYMERLQGVFASQDWNARKSVIEVLEVAINRMDVGILTEHKKAISTILETAKFDKMKPVREHAVQVIQLWKTKDGVHNIPVALSTSVSKGARTPVVEEAEQEAVEDDDAENQAPGALGREGSGGDATPTRTPLQEKASANASRGGNRQEALTIEALSTSKRGNNPAASEKPHVPSAGAAEPGPVMGFAPSREQWDQLLSHFDRMTVQQTNLIQMVQAFGDSARERLETVEQKVFAIELKLQHMDNRQRTPSLPPTPARAGASYGGHATPSRSAVKALNVHPEHSPGVF
mmetsp:Transcript_61897/g.147417  ORF Transcript_61897/g.147417 Transcript_61897/m.147417 type:complete len:548 (+) Transcript_61897:2-1645(+)